MYKLNTLFIDNIEGCKTKEDIGKFIFGSMRYYTQEPKDIIDGETWIIMYGFRIGTHCHNIFFNAITKEYAFHASLVKLYTHRNIRFPNFGRYNTYDEMVVGVVDQYANIWKI